MNKTINVLYEASNTFYTVGSPVQLIKYQIVRKRNSEETFARLVFGRKCKRRVRSVVFDFQTFDDAGTILDERGEQSITADRYIPTFDGKTLFPVSSGAKQLRLRVTRVIFENERKIAPLASAAHFPPTGQTTERSFVWEPQEPTLQKISHDKTVTCGEYAVELTECLTDKGARKKFDYHDYGSSWLCSCGMLNDERDTCALCHAKKADVENAFKPETLEERRRSDTYESAVKTAEETHSIKTVNESIDKLTTLGDYKDSPQQIETCKAHIKGIKKAWAIFSAIMAVILIAISALLIWLAAEDKKVDALYLKDEGYNGGYSFTVNTTETRGQNELVIPATYKGTAITTVGERAFWKTDLKVVTLPATIQTVKADAFTDCSVEEVHFEGTLAEWSAISFANPSATPAYCGAKIYLSGDVLIDGELCLPDTVTEIGNYAFYGWENIHTVRNMDKLTKIGNYAFSKTSLESADLSSLTSLGTGALFETKLTEVTIPDGITWLGEKCFPAELKKLSLPSLCKYESASKESILAVFFDTDDNLIEYYKNTSLKELTVRGGTLPEKAFRNFEALTTVNLPSSATVIPTSAFRGCTALTALTLPSTVWNISDYAFEDCTHLSTIVIPSSVTTIGKEVFSGCSALSVYYGGNQTQWEGTTVGEYNDDLTENLYLYSETEPATSSYPLWHYDTNGAPVKYNRKKVVFNTASDDQTVTMALDGYSTTYLKIEALTSGSLSVKSNTGKTGIYGYLYDAAKKNALASNEPSYSADFSYTYSVTAGKTYYIAVKNRSASYSTKLNAKILLSGVMVQAEDNSATVVYYKKGETVPFGETPSRSGFKFLGWYSNGNKLSGDSVTARKDYTITARWHKLASVTLTYINSDNSTTATSVSDLSSYSYHLLHVSKKSSVSISATAKYSYSTTVELYESDKDTVLKSVSLSYVSSYTCSGTLTVTLSEGDYYYYATSTTTATITSGSAAFVTKLDRDTSTKKSTEDTVLTLPTPKRTGYIFTGWTLGGKAIKGTTYTVPDHDVTLVATWTDKANVTLIYDNGTEPTTTAVAIGSRYALPTDILKEGLAFESWCIDLGDEGLGTEVSNNYTIPSHHVTLRAKWTDKANLTLIYDNGETETETIRVTIGDTYDLPTPEKAGGYEFRGWYVQLDSGELGDKVEGSSYVMPDRHVTLRARWPKDVTVTFDEGPSFITTDSVTFSSGAYKKFSATKNGSVSIRVETSSSSTVKIYDADKTTLLSSWSGIYIATVSCSLKANQDYYLYCTKSGSASISSDYVAFVTGEQNKVSTRPAIEGHLLDYPTPEKAGHFFLGWYLDDGKIDPATYTAPDHDITLTAKWAKNTTVTFELGGYVEEYASGSTSASYEYPSSERKALMVEETGEVTFNFSGYSYGGIYLYDEKFNQLTQFASASSYGSGSGNYTLEAGKLYYVSVGGATYVSVSGSCHPYFPIKHVEKRATYVGAEITFPEPDERDGFSFYGWFQGEQSLAGDFFIVPNENDVTVTAEYTPIA